MIRPTDIGVAVVTRDSPRAAIVAAQSCGLPPDQVVVIHNDSVIQAEQEVRAAVPDAVHISIAGGASLTHCWNQGIIKPRVWEWTVLANDDVQFDADWIGKLNACMSGRPHALHIGMAYPTNRYSCFAVHRDLVRAIGWFDERFKGYFYEDDDWHLRMCEYVACKPGTRVHERDEDGIFAVCDCALHDHALRAADANRFQKRAGLSRDANKAFFAQKWREDKDGWLSKGKIDGEYRRFVRALPEVNPYPGVRL
jgi:hypothetical protein